MSKEFLSELIKIKKSYRNGANEFYLFLKHYQCYKDGLLWEENINHYVEERCDKDGAGHNYGYDYSWEIVTDIMDIESEVIVEHKRCQRQIEELEQRKKELMDLLAVKTLETLESKKNK